MYKLAINRPITILMAVLALIVFGLMSFKKMPVALFPNVDFPIITVQTTYYGADPSTIESKVTDKIEETLSGIDGIDKLRSSSYEGVSIVTIEFDLSKNIEEAANDVRDKISSLKLPQGVEKPIITKLDVGGGSVLNLAISSNGIDDIELMKLVDEKIKPKLQRVKDVGSVTIVGFRERQLRIYPDLFLLAKHSITLNELNNIIRADNLKQGGGKFVGSEFERVLKIEGDAKSVDELKNLQIRPGVLLGDVAKVEDALEDAKSYASFNGRDSVIVEIRKVTGSNVLFVIDGIKEILPSLQESFGSEVTITPLKDGSEFIKASVDNVKFDLIYGSILAVFIVFVFLRNLSATIISAFAIPSSVIGTFAIIDYLGYDLNRLTLIGLTLAIGIFIDDAIVVVENISKKLEEGMEPFRASIEGVKEISFSILAISALLLAVFIPVAFMGGIVGRFFNSFAMTVASGVVISYAIAVLFIPTLSARILRESNTLFYKKSQKFYDAIDRAYVATIRLLLKHKFITMVGLILVIAFSIFFAKGIGGEFVPPEDKSEFTINIKAPVGTNLESMKSYCSGVLEILSKDEDVLLTSLMIGYNRAKELHKAQIYVKLTPPSKRKLHQEEIIKNYRTKLKPLQNLVITVTKIPPFEGVDNQPIQIVLKGDDLTKLSSSAKKLQEILKNSGGVVDIDSNHEDAKPELRVSINRLNAAKAGVNINDIAKMLYISYSSDEKLSSFEESGKEYDITFRLSDEKRLDESSIKSMFIRNKDSNLISLDALVDLNLTNAPSSINRFDRQRQITISASNAGLTLDRVVSLVDSSDFLQQGQSFSFVGDIEKMKETAMAFIFAVVLTVVLMYFILASLYESLVEPFIIMITMPLAILGVVVALKMASLPFSLFVMFGIILLLGMVGKNAVLVVDFANRELKSTTSVDKALLLAGKMRLRPILMTTFAMIFAMIPLAIGGGSGHEVNNSLATAVIGGLISSTVLTLLVVPTIYKILYPLDRWLRRFYEREI